MRRINDTPGEQRRGAVYQQSVLGRSFSKHECKPCMMTTLGPYESRGIAPALHSLGACIMHDFTHQQAHLLNALKEGIY